MGEVLHASHSGWFPFCLPSFDPTGYVNFTAASKDVVMKSFWVLKSFTISGSYLDLNLNPRNFSVTLETSAEQEEGLVCAPSWVVKSSSNVNNFNGSWYDGSNFYQYNESIVPDYGISGLFEDAGGGGFALTSLDASGYPETFSFEGMTLFGVGGFSITPNEYWSYEGTWDTETGELL